MSPTRRTRWLAFLGLLLAVVAIMPVVARGSPLIERALPTWAIMVVQALAAIAALALLAFVAAALVSAYRARKNSNG